MPQRRKRVRRVNLQKTRIQGEPALRTLKWTPLVLRGELQAMLSRSKLSALDLLSAFDKSDDGTLSKQEFLNLVRRKEEHLERIEKSRLLRYLR